MPMNFGPAPAHVAEWASILLTLEAAGRFPAQTPEVRQQKAKDCARSEARLQRLKADARCLRDYAASSAPLSDDVRARLQEIEEEPLTSRRPGDPIRVTSLDR